MDRGFPGRKVMIVAGEASGDAHGARLVEAMRKMEPDLAFMGVGGKAMKDRGVDIAVDSARLSVVGITEVFVKLPRIVQAIKTVSKMLRRRRPDLLVLIDFPDFNLMVAAMAKRLGVPVLYYISPQVWAWRTGRVRKIRRLVDQMAVILPFEEPFYRKSGVPVTFVGHPLMESSKTAPAANFVKEAFEKPVLGLLPGSRDREVTHLLPIMIEAARGLKKSFPGLKVLASVASSLDRKFVERIVERNRGDLQVEIVEGGASDVFMRSTVLAAASGTVTLEAALAGVPAVIVYKVSPLSYRLAKTLVRVEYASLANLIARKELLPELLQDKASAENLFSALKDLLDDPEKTALIRKQLLLLRNVFGGPGASARVARIALDMMK